VILATGGASLFPAATLKSNILSTLTLMLSI
jgi:hypothetical protein